MLALHEELRCGPRAAAPGEIQNAARVHRPQLRCAPTRTTLKRIGFGTARKWSLMDESQTRSCFVRVVLPGATILEKRMCGASRNGHASSPPTQIPTRFMHRGVNPSPTHTTEVLTSGGSERVDNGNPSRGFRGGLWAGAVHSCVLSPLSINLLVLQRSSLQQPPPRVSNIIPADIVPRMAPSWQQCLLGLQYPGHPSFFPHPPLHSYEGCRLSSLQALLYLGGLEGSRRSAPLSIPQHLRIEPRDKDPRTARSSARADHGESGDCLQAHWRSAGGTSTVSARPST